MYQWTFEKNKWNDEKFVQLHSPIHPYESSLVQKDDHIENTYRQLEHRKDYYSLLYGSGDEEIIGMDRNDYAHIAYLLKDKLSGTVSMSADVLFEEFGSPFFTIADEIYIEDGKYYPKSEIQVVIYHQGINFWHLVYEDKNIDIKLLSTFSFPLFPNQKYSFSAVFNKDYLSASINDKEYSLKIKGLESFHAGFGMCESINHFYNLTIQQL